MPRQLIMDTVLDSLKAFFPSICGIIKTPSKYSTPLQNADEGKIHFETSKKNQKRS